MKDLVGITAVILTFAAYVPYFRDILKKKSIPHPYSWLVWGFTNSVIFTLQITHGAGPGAYATAAAGIICLSIAVLAFRNGAKKYITTTDTILLATAVLAVVLWIFVKQPVLSIILLVGADIIGIIPSVRKAWKRPYEETLSMWLISTLRHVISLLALREYNFITLLNPVAWIIANGTFSLILILRRKKK